MVYLKCMRHETELFVRFVNLYGMPVRQSRVEDAGYVFSFRGDLKALEIDGFLRGSLVRRSLLDCAPNCFVSFDYYSKFLYSKFLL